MVGERFVVVVDLEKDHMAFGFERAKVMLLVRVVGVTKVVEDGDCFHNPFDGALPQGRDTWRHDGQAADQVDAVCTVRPISEVRVFSRRRDRRESLCAQLTAAHPGVSFHPSGSSAEAVRGADVICTATRSSVPLFTGGDLGPDVHINAVGAYTAQMCEVPAAAFARATSSARWPSSRAP